MAPGLALAELAAAARDAATDEGVAMVAPLIRAERRRRGWSQLTLASRAELDLKTIQDIEAGRNPRPRPRTLARLAAALDLPPAALEAAAARDAEGHDR